MTHDSESLKAGREETDASLRIERATADEALARTVAEAGRKLDALIARDRVLADKGVMKFRGSADARLARERSAAPEPSSEVVDERLGADLQREAERSFADALLERERGRTNAHGEAKRQKEAPAQAPREALRHSTDGHLSDERLEADSVAVERDDYEIALEAAHSAEVGRADVFAMVTHELRNPLCVIVANACVIEEGGADTATREAAGDITRAAARMGRLLSDLLDVARIDAGTLRLDKRPLSVRELLSEISRSYRPVFDDRGVTLSVDCPPETLVATVDHDRVVQVLSNLLGNAMKFTPEGGHVDVHVEDDEGELAFVVRDDGAGIEPSALPHLFERFWQRDPDTRRSLGLGLYLCRTIARAHAGDISVQSQVGAGSTFRVSLPMG